MVTHTSDHATNVPPRNHDENLDPTLSGNDDSPDLPDQSMQWGVRWDNGVVSVERDQEAASLAVNAWTARGVQAALVCRVCGPWQ